MQRRCFALALTLDDATPLAVSRLQEQEFERAAASDADMTAALALAAGCDLAVAAQAADDDGACAREIALSDAACATRVAADAARALRFSFEEPVEVDTDEVRKHAAACWR